MAMVGAFAASDQGRFYASVCHDWRVDPGAPIADDVVAFNLRAALTLATAERAPADDHEAGGRAFEQEWLSG